MVAGTASPDTVMGRALERASDRITADTFETREPADARPAETSSWSSAPATSA